jgi:hypothetical protein
MMSESVVEHNSKLERTIPLHGISLTDPELDPTAQDAGSIYGNRDPPASLFGFNRYLVTAAILGTTYYFVFCIWTLNRNFE